MNLSTPIMLLFLLMGCARPSAEETRQALDSRLQQHRALLEQNRRYFPLVSSEAFSFHGIEAIYVEIGKPYYSWIGHVFLRLVGSGATPLDDLCISFLPTFQDASTENLKAYYGGYPIFPVVKRWGEFLEEYVTAEGRYVERHILKSTQAQRSQVLSKVRSWMAEPTKVGTFSFRRQNCTYWQLNLLQQAGFPVSRDRVVFPIDFINYLSEQDLLTHAYPRLSPKDPRSRWANLKNRSAYQ